MNEINNKIKEVSDNISRQLERDIEMFGSSYLEVGEFFIKRVDPTTVTITLPVNHKITLAERTHDALVAEREQ